MPRNQAPIAGVNARWLALASSCALLATLPAIASDLDVQQANANTGIYAARVAVGSDCTADTHEVVSGAIVPGTHEGCSTLTSDGVLAAGIATFRAGDLVILRDGFAVETGASLTIEIDRALYPDAWVQDDTPDGETVYSARFYLDPSSVALGASDRFYHFLAFDAAGDAELRVGLKQNGTERRLFLEAIEDDDNVETTEGAGELLLANGWHWVEVGWTAGAGDGSAFICLDAETPPTGCVELSNLDNDTGAIDFVRWGAIDVPSESELGSVDLDDFESRSSLNIGPLP